MASEKQILEAGDVELSKLLGQVLVKKRENECSMCDGHRGYYNQHGKLTSCTLCAHRYFIDIKNWNVAMKLRDQYAEDEDMLFAFIAALETVWKSGDMELCFEQWLIFAKPKHLLQAAAIAKLNSEKGTK